MKVERKKIHGNINRNIINFKNYYVGCPAGPIFLSSPKILKFRRLSKELPEYYAKNKYFRICEDESRFSSLNEEIEKEAIKENFRKNLNSYETVEDINNFIHLSDSNHLIKGAKEQAKAIERGKRLALNNGIFKPNDLEEETIDYIA